MIRQYVGARYVPKFYENSLNPLSNEWEENVNYEALTVVTYLNDSYTSKKPVPVTVGNPRNNPEYWCLTGAYNAQIEQYRSEVVNLSNNIGDLDDLETEDKSTIVNAINSLLNVENTIYADDYCVGDGVTDDTNNIINMLNDAKDLDLIIFGYKKTYKTTDSIIITKDLKINLNGSTILNSSGNAFYIGKDPFIETVTTSEVVNGNFNVANSNNIEIGDICVISSTSQYDAARTYYKCGGSGVVTQKTGNNISISNSFPTQSIPSGSSVLFIKPTTSSIFNGYIKSSSVGASLTGIYIRYGYNCKIENVSIFDCQINIRNRASVNSIIKDFTIIGGKPNNTYDYSGYGIEIDEATNTTVSNGFIYSGQHGLSVGGFLPSYNNKLMNLYVSSEFTSVSFDHHATAFNSIIENVTAGGFSFFGNVILKNSNCINTNGIENDGIRLQGNTESSERASFSLENIIIKGNVARLKTGYDQTDYQDLLIQNISVLNLKTQNGITIGNGVGNCFNCSIENAVCESSYFNINKVRHLKISNCEALSDLILRNITRNAIILSSVFNKLDISINSSVTVIDVRTIEENSSITSIYGTLIGLNISGTLTKSITRSGYLNAYDSNGLIS